MAVAAGRAAIGGPREVLLGVLLGARLAAGAIAPHALTVAQRRARADAARHWLGTIAIPGAPKIALTRLIDITVSGNAEAVAAALAKVTDVTAPYLDRAARSELDSLRLALAL
ncbi:MAG: hypothetical protein O2973_00980 [Gemmatimonadetes bacterium]|nr:hypothetical protein [Gemmatimonadota bacterium]